MTSLMARSTGAAAHEMDGKCGTAAPAPLDTLEDAQTAGLRYVSDQEPGFRRIRAGKGFSYRDLDGRKITDGAVLRRIKSLVIPPAWTEVWICPSSRGHIQATGRDKRGRKQYRYHPRWREVRDANKFDKMIAFAEALPRIRERIRRDLGGPGLSREKVLAAVIALLERTLIRIGNSEYARDNQSFGLTTLQDGHVDFEGATISFSFRSKSGKEFQGRLTDRRLARIVKSCQDIPGQHLFQYYDEDGSRRPLASEDVNAYIREIAGEDFSAKDFRTWAGTVLMVAALREIGPPENKTETKRNLAAAVKQVAGQLANTPAVCRKCYIHPIVADAYEDGWLLDRIDSGTLPESDLSCYGLHGFEPVVLGFLRQCRPEAGGEPNKRATR